MNPANWIIALCATGAHNYAAIVACILISTALAPSLAAASERRSGGDESPAAVEQQGDFVTVATWYGPGYEGRRTTNGEIFDSSKLTAASLVFPLGSHVTVTSLNEWPVGYRSNQRLRIPSAQEDRPLTRRGATN